MLISLPVLEKALAQEVLGMNYSGRFSVLFLVLSARVVWRPLVARADVTSSILGIVNDSTGHAVPKATVIQHLALC
jgi:hypothetical protein